MIDFKNAKFLKLRLVSTDALESKLNPMLISDERILGAYRTVRDSVVFTTKRIIAINFQGITGVKVDYTTLPYNRIHAFSIETDGLLDIDSTLELWYSELGSVKFEFTGNTNLTDICQYIGNAML